MKRQWGISGGARGVYRVAGIVLLVAAAGTASADPRIKATRETEATGDIFKEYSPLKKAYGFVPNEYEAMSQDLTLLRLHEAYAQGLLGTVRHLTAQQKAMIGLVVGSSVGSDYVRKFEGWDLERLGLKEDQVRRVEQDFQSAGLKPADVAALKFAKKLATSASEIAEQDFADLRWDGLTDPEILEITLVSSYFIDLARLAQVLAIEPDSYPEVTH